MAQAVSSSRRKTARAKKAKPLPATKTRVETLEKRLKASRKQVAMLQKIVAGFADGQRGEVQALLKQWQALDDKIERLMGFANAWLRAWRIKEGLPPDAPELGLPR